MYSDCVNLHYFNLIKNNIFHSLKYSCNVADERGNVTESQPP